jgi:hypothetical protein
MSKEYHTVLKYIVEYNYEILKNLDISKQIAFLSLNSMIQYLNKQYPDLSERLKEMNEQQDEEIKKERELTRKIFDIIGGNLMALNEGSSVDDFKRVFNSVCLQLKNTASEVEKLKDSHYKMMRLMEWYVPVEDKDDALTDMLENIEMMRDNEYHVLHIKKPPVPKVEMTDGETSVHIHTDNSLKTILEEIFIDEDEDEFKEETQKESANEEVYDNNEHAINFMEWNYKDQEQHISMKIDFIEIPPTPLEKIQAVYDALEEQLKQSIQETIKREHEEREKIMEKFRKLSEGKRKIYNPNIDDELNDVFGGMSLTPQSDATAQVLEEIIPLETRHIQYSVLEPEEDEPPEPDEADMSNVSEEQ